jgi:hypothetical protein
MQLWQMSRNYHRTPLQVRKLGEALLLPRFRDQCMTIEAAMTLEYLVGGGIKLAKIHEPLSH